MYSCDINMIFFLYNKIRYSKCKAKLSVRTGRKATDLLFLLKKGDKRPPGCIISNVANTNKGGYYG